MLVAACSLCCTCVSCGGVSEVAGVRAADLSGKVMSLGGKNFPAARVLLLVWCLTGKVFSLQVGFASRSGRRVCGACRGPLGPSLPELLLGVLLVAAATRLQVL